LAAVEWIYFIFIFSVGCCVGSFLNVVIYRLPAGKSIVSPPSACPACGTHIRFYDNIPLLSWVLLWGKCRNCKAPISVRYFIVELLTGLLFTGLFALYFYLPVRSGIGSFAGGGWLIYLIHIILIAAFLAASAIDLELWIIPLSICWFVTAVGILGSALAGYVIDVDVIRGFDLLPSASANTAALAAGAAIGLVISLLLVKIGLIKRSYESQGQVEDEPVMQGSDDSGQYNHRMEAWREVVFLLPIIVCSWGFLELVTVNAQINSWWLELSQRAVVAGILGSIWGYLIGCAVVWATRILGTMAFGKEAMGLGDVHLMGAAGAVVGPVFVVVAFFIAPFFGLAWAGVQMFSQKVRQIPYGPFLSIGVLVVIILHDWIFSYFNFILYH